jgi:cellulose synthase/poly-beta-1,6-N-acetylglucosamine synthase-like glycosyltransferase
VVRRELDQYFSAEEAGLADGAKVAITGVDVGSVADAGTGLDQPALSASRTTASPAAGPRPLPPFPRKFSPAVLLVYIGAVLLVYLGIALFLGAHTPGVFVQVSVSLLLAPVIWQVGGWLYRARRARTAATGTSPAAGRTDLQWTVRATLRLALAASLLWIVWVRGGAWQYGVVVAVALPIAIGLPRRLTNRDWAEPRPDRPPSAWVTIGQLAVLNALVALALLDTARFPFGFWAIHTKIAYAIMCGADVLLLKSALAASRAVKGQAAQNYVLTPGGDQAVTATGSRQGGRALPKRPARFRSRPLTRLGGRARPVIASCAVALAFVWVGYAHPGPLVIVAALVIGAAVLALTDVNRRQAITMLLAVGFGISAADYMGWRIAVTNWPGWWIAVPLLFAEMLGAIHTLGFQLTVWPWPPPVLEAGEAPAPREVFMLIATVNEGVDIIRQTLTGCLAARERYLAQYPDGQVTIVVCNDGLVAKYPHWTDIVELAQELGVCCVTRTIPGGAKAGNIENARQHYRITGSRLMAIFDADQVPTADFLVKTVPPFADPKIGWVQTGQYYSNLANPVSRWADDQQSMFYNLLCPGKAALNAAFICGTNVVLRAAALDEIGGLPQDSVTEDFAASIKLHARWRSIYLTDILATGLGPLDVPSFLKQQGRWALGTLTAFRGHWADILLPRKNGLRLGQRIQYFLAGTHYLCGLRDLIYIISPALFIFTGVPAVRTATLSQYMLHFLPYGLLGLVGMWYCARGVTGLRGVIIGFGSTPALLSSLYATVTFRKKPFALTSKSRDGRQSHRYLGVYIAPLILCFAALAWTTQVHGRQATSMFISLLWVVYSIVMLLSYLWLAYADIRARRAGEEEMLARQPYPAKMLIRGSSVRPVLNLGLAALVASPLLLGLRLASLPMFGKSAAAFAITAQQADARYVGVSVPVRQLTSAPPLLERDLGVGFSIMGRTQLITDQFDSAWASELATRGARPWITLQFGVLGAHQLAPLDANLPAIYNGVDDSALRRWATEIRDFGKPVYLTVLLQVDRNWAVSSAVADGGIPQDVPKAWLHIQSVFRSVGANNVGWVWAPADPLHDQQFAPPPSSIDAVLQDFIDYPGTQWGNPGKALPSLVKRYPGKPIFVEVAADGPAAEKVAWLARLRTALADCPQVYALLYHEGGPLLNGTPAQLKAWSEASDPQSLAAWRQIVTTLRGKAGHGDLCRALCQAGDRGRGRAGTRPGAGAPLAAARGARAPVGGRHHGAAQLGVPGRGPLRVRGPADYPPLGRWARPAAGLRFLLLRLPVHLPADRRVSGHDRRAHARARLQPGLHARRDYDRLPDDGQALRPPARDLRGRRLRADRRGPVPQPAGHLRSSVPAADRGGRRAGRARRHDPAGVARPGDRSCDGPRHPHEVRCAAIYPRGVLDRGLRRPGLRRVAAGAHPPANGTGVLRGQPGRRLQADGQGGLSRDRRQHHQPGGRQQGAPARAAPASRASHGRRALPHRLRRPAARHAAAVAVATDLAGALRVLVAYSRLPPLRARTHLARQAHGVRDVLRRPAGRLRAGLAVRGRARVARRPVPG